MKKVVATIALRVMIIGSTIMMIFQLSLALGAPLGHAAWGGMYNVLPKNLRAESFFSAFLFFCGIIVFRGRAGKLSHPPSLLFFRLGSILLALMFSISALLNLVSYSAWERYLMAPIALLLAICGWIIVGVSHKQSTN